jgi:hypothetical protein
MLGCPAAITQTYRGTIHGVVYDSSGAVLVGATVTASNSANGQRRSTQVPRGGSFFATVSGGQAGLIDHTARAVRLHRFVSTALPSRGISKNSTTAGIGMASRLRLQRVRRSNRAANRGFLRSLSCPKGHACFLLGLSVSDGRGRTFRIQEARSGSWPSPQMPTTGFHPTALLRDRCRRSCRCWKTRRSTTHPTPYYFRCRSVRSAVDQKPRSTGSEDDGLTCGAMRYRFLSMRVIFAEFCCSPRWSVLALWGQPGSTCFM